MTMKSRTGVIIPVLFILLRQALLCISKLIHKEVLIMMNHGNEDLKKKILLKKVMLNSIKRADNKDAARVRSELDSLLYKYYKSLGCDC